MIENKVMGWLETVSNRRADQWMKTAVRDGLYHRPWMRSAVIAPPVRMDGGYLLRTLGLICGGLVVGQLTLLVLGLAGMYGAVMYHARAVHGGAPLPPAHDALTAFKEMLEIMLPAQGFLCSISALTTMVWLNCRAYFWNRRAQRLQANPTPFVSDPSAWPPPPRIAG